MLSSLTRLIVLGSTVVLVGACSRVETSRTTHLNNQKSFKENQAQLLDTQKQLTQQEQAQFDMMNEEKMRNHFAGGFKEEKNADGTAKMATDKRSGFEQKKYGEDGSSFTDKKFATKAFDKKSFAGRDKQFDTSEWKKKDALDEMKLDTPEFAKRQSDFRKEDTEFSGKQYADLKGKSDESGKKWDQGVKNPEHLMNKEALDKKDSIAKPDVMNSREAQLKTVDEVRSLMGRE